MDIEGLPKDPTRAKVQVFVSAWKRAEELGIDAAGLTGPLVAKVVAEREAELAKIAAGKAAKSKNGKAQDVDGDAPKPDPDADKAPAGKPAQTAPQGVSLIDLKVDHLKKIADFLEIPVADARKKDVLCEAISKSDAWQKADQKKVVEATAAA